MGDIYAEWLEDRKPCFEKVIFIPVIFFVNFDDINRFFNQIFTE